MDFPRQALHGDRYYAAPDPCFGVCVYALLVAGEWQMYAQTIPIPTGVGTTDMHMCFVQFTMTLANGMGEEFEALRKQYPYLMATDVLTLKCLILEALDNWRTINARLENRDADARTGESVDGH